MVTPIIEASADHYAYGQAVQRRALADLTGMWVRTDRERILESWGTTVAPAAVLVAQAQQAVAEDAIDYTQALAEVQDHGEPTHQVIAAGFAGMAYPLGDRPRQPVALQDTLAAPAFTALRAIKSGATTERAMGIGLDNLLLRSQMQIADAARQAEAVAMSATPRQMVYVRMLNPPSCSRCAILAGKTYRSQEAFARHPGCDCRHIPVAESLAGDLATDPYSYFRSLSGTEQDKYFTKAGAEAIREGADIFQVVNARQAMYEATGGALATYTGTTRRGYWGSAQATSNRRQGERYGRAVRERLMPEEIFKRANGDREQARKMLEDYGYITGLGQDPDGVVRGPGVGYFGSRKPSYRFDPATGSYNPAPRNAAN
ncbi:hypothetical protein [Glutamicibacter sp. PS]|uniref:hypothetical protein n=1 Tax=Glutamicibacter sp. PS TaxID=3075634 RepID=UPI002844AC5C|nr:hypothetical protein [Glutamicibacter sp. PS]MDR4533220.1 hypothetical protein [Glutamicibacter sp. PS]